MQKLTSGLEQITVWFLRVAVSIMIFTIALSIFGRTIVNLPITWCQEISCMSFLWIGFLGTSIGVKRKEHFEVTIISNRLSGRSAEILKLFVNLAILTVVTVIGYHSIEFVQMGRRTFSALTGITYFWTYISVPISMVLIVIYVIEDIIKKLKLIKQNP